MIDPAKYTKELSNLFDSPEILLICHINPDGDSIGSQLALFHYLTSKGKKVGMISPNNLQEFLNWMDGTDKIEIFIRDRKKCISMINAAGLIVLLDFNQLSRLGEAEKYVTGSKARKVVIDHHLDPQQIADLTITDPARCSTAELLHELISSINGGPFLNKSYSEAIYVGIITDTGNFGYGSYTGKTLRIVAGLLETGIDRDRILNTVYNNFSADRLRLEGFALHQRMVVLPEYHAAYIWLTRKDLSDYSHSKGDTEGFVNLPLSIRGINFSVLFIEKDKFVKLSFRSKGSFPVNTFAAKYFSGGGHLNASGGEYYDTLDNTISYFLKVLKEQTEKSE
ncbi:MAG: DHH family phosphoesterase [Bacteroidales bacterium]